MPVRFKAFKAEYYDERAFEDAAKRIFDQTEKDFEEGFAGTVATWKHDVDFRARRQISSSRAVLAYGTDDDVYRYVNDGTRPHEIRPKRARSLSFRTGYRAKTRRRSLKSGGGGASGPQAFAKKVKHPGTEAREFDKEVVRRTQPRFERYVHEEIDTALRKRRGRP